MNPISSESYDEDYAALQANFPGHLPLLALHLKKCSGADAPVGGRQDSIGAMVQWCRNDPG